MLSVKAKELELAIKREDIDYVRAHHTETMTLYKELQYNLSKLFSPVVKTTVSHLDAFSVLIVDDDKLNEDFIMPEAFDPRVAEVVSQAVKSHI